MTLPVPGRREPGQHPCFQVALPDSSKTGDTCELSGFNFEVQQNIVALRPIRGEMFIESATSKKFFLAPAERNIVWSDVPMTETLRSAGARVIELEAVSINISLPWSEN